MTDKKKKKKWFEIPFEFKDLGCRKNLGVFHPNVENGDKLLGWMDKPSAEHYRKKHLTS
jgi:hypothetical protein